MPLETETRAREAAVDLKKWDPLKDILFLQEQMSRIFDEAFTRFRGPGGLSGGWYPPVDIYETADRLVLKAEVPGVEIGDVEIEVEDSTLVLKGERKPKKNLSQENYHRMERYHGTFTRAFSLPDIVDREGVKASLTDGVLEITVPKLKRKDAESIRVPVE